MRVRASSPTLSSHDFQASSPLPQVVRVEGRGGHHSHTPSTSRQMNGGSSSPTPTGPAPLHQGEACMLSTSRPSLLCCPVKVQGLLSQVLQSLRGRASSPAPMTSGSAPSVASGGERQGGGEHLPCSQDWPPFLSGLPHAPRPSIIRAEISKACYCVDFVCDYIHSF